MSNLDDPQVKLTLRRLVAAWSDHWQSEAAKFTDSHRDLLPGRITNAQLYGLSNVVHSTHHYAYIKKFIEHQAEKAGRWGRLDAQGYWNDLINILNKLRSEAQSILQQLSLPKASSAMILDKVHYELVIAFVQHLIAHSLYWTLVEEGEQQ